MTEIPDTPHTAYEVFRVKSGEIVAPDVTLSVARIMVAAADTMLSYRRAGSLDARVQNTETV